MLRHLVNTVGYILSDCGPYGGIIPTDVTITFTPCWVRYDNDKIMTYDGPHDVVVRGDYEWEAEMRRAALSR